MKKQKLGFYYNASVAPTPSYDPMTTAYMTAISVPNDATVYFTGDTWRQKTGTQWWNQVDAFVKDIKGIGAVNNTIDFSSKFFALRLFTNGSSVKNSVNLMNPGTHDIVSFGGSYIYSANGCYNDYADGGIQVSDFPSLTSFYFGITTGANPLIASNVPYGAYGYKMGLTTAGNVIGIFNFPNDIRFTTRGNNAQITNDDFAIGDYCVNQTSTGKTQGIVHGSKVVEYAETCYNSFSGNIYIGALNNGGSGVNLDTSLQRMDYYANTELTPTEYAMWTTITNTYLTNWGCSMGVMDVYGDSILVNIGVTAGNRVTDLVGTGKNWSVRNYAKSGTSLENAIPIDSIDGPNFYTNRVAGSSPTAVKTYIPSYHKAILIGYGMNDIGLNYATYNTTTFSTQDLAAVDYINANQGWPYAKMVRCGNTLAIYPQAGDYYVTFEGVPVAADQARDNSFRSTYTADSVARSLINVDSRSSMTITDLFGEGIHPNTAGCLVIANNILTNITGL